MDAGLLQRLEIGVSSSFSRVTSGVQSTALVGEDSHDTRESSVEVHAKAELGVRSGVHVAADSSERSPFFLGVEVAIGRASINDCSWLALVHREDSQTSS